MCYISELYMRERPIAGIATHRSGWDQSSPWKHTDQSSCKRLGIGSLQQSYYHTKRFCMMKLQRSGMHHTIQTKWNVRNATVCD